MLSHPRRAFLVLVALFIFGLVVCLSQWAYFHPQMYVIDADGTAHLIQHVALTEKAMVPDALTVHVGEYVQFDTADTQSHQIGLGGGDEYGKGHEHVGIGEFESGTFGPDEAYRLQFKKAGVYDFHDHMHPKLFITVIAY